MKKTTPLILLFLLLFCFAEGKIKEIPGQLITVDGETIDVILLIPVYRQEISFIQLQFKPKYKKDDASVEEPILHETVKEFQFTYGYEMIRMLSIKNSAKLSLSLKSYDNVYLKVLMDGRQKLLMYYEKADSGSFPDGLGGHIYNTSIKEKFVLKKDGQKMLVYTPMFFRDQLAKYFYDCPTMIERVKRKTYKRNEIERIVEEYNASNCVEWLIFNKFEPQISKEELNPSMYYIVQENVFRDIHYNLVIKALERLKLEHEIVKLNNTDSFNFKTTRKDVFCFGSIKLARLAKQNAWVPGSLMNANHDYSVYANYWKGNLLNWDGRLQMLEDPVEFKNSDLFIRPTKDSKIFNGKVYTKEEWAGISEKLLTRETLKKELIQISNPKKIYQEVRCWIVNAKVVSASVYKQGNEVRYVEYNDEDGLKFANKMTQQYQPADAFVLDICLAENGWKIVEVNCINSAGFYACNLQKLIIELENFYCWKYTRNKVGCPLSEGYTTQATAVIATAEFKNLRQEIDLLKPKLE